MKYYEEQTCLLVTGPFIGLHPVCKEDERKKGSTYREISKEKYNIIIKRFENLGKENNQ